MKAKWYISLAKHLGMSWDDLKMLLFVGVPFGIILILMQNCFDFTHLH